MGGIVLVVCIFVSMLYVIGGRFRFVSFLRRERVVHVQVQNYRHFNDRLDAAEKTIYTLVRNDENRAKIRRIILQIRKSTTSEQALKGFGTTVLELIKVIVFAISSIFICVLATVAIFVFFVAVIFFKTLIIYKHSASFLKVSQSYRVIISEVVSLTLSAVSGLPPFVVSLFSAALSFALEIFDFLATFKFDLSGLGVTCSGAAAPFELLLNLVVLGGVIIVVLSGMQLFRNLTFRATMSAYYTHILSREYRTTETKDFKWFEIVGWWLWYLGVLILATFLQLLYFLINFQSLLQFLVSLVQLKVFTEDKGFHPDTPSCNGVTGFINFDFYLARGSTVLGYFLLLPVFYEVSRVLCPNEPEEENDGKAKTYKSPTRHRCKDITETDETTTPLNVNLCGSENSVSSLFLSLPLSAWIRLPITIVSPDLIIAYLTGSLLKIIPYSHESAFEETQESVNDDGEKVTALTKRARKDAESSIEQWVKSSLYSLCRGALVTLREFRRHDRLTSLLPPEAGSEADLWRQEQDFVLLPSYFGLLEDELHALTCGSKYFEPSRAREWGASGYPIIGYCLCALLFLFPVGHIFTGVGYYAMKRVLNKYRTFLLACLGYWSDFTYKAYAIKTEIEENSSRERKGYYSDCLEAAIAPRAIILQLVPYLTIFSIFAISTSGSPMFVSNTELAENIAPYFQIECFTRAVEQFEDTKYKTRDWIVGLRGVSIFLLESRLLKYLFSAFTVFVSVYVLLFGVNMKIVVATVSILLPISLAHSLEVIILLGKAFNVKDFWKILCGPSVGLFPSTRSEETEAFKARIERIYNDMTKRRNIDVYAEEIREKWERMVKEDRIKEKKKERKGILRRKQSSTDVEASAPPGHIATSPIHGVEGYSTERDDIPEASMRPSLATRPSLVEPDRPLDTLRRSQHRQILIHSSISAPSAAGPPHSLQRVTNTPRAPAPQNPRRLGGMAAEQQLL